MAASDGGALPLRSVFYADTTADGAMKALTCMVMGIAGTVRDGGTLGKVRLLLADRGLWGIDDSGLSFTTCAQEGPPDWPALSRSAAESLQLSITVEKDPAHEHASYVLISFYAHAETTCADVEALHREIAAHWPLHTTPSAETERGPGAHMPPKWVPRKADTLKRWREAYKVICAMRDERRDPDDWGNDPKPRLADYRDRLKDNLDWAPSEKTIGRIIGAGGAGWLKTG